MQPYLIALSILVVLAIVMAARWFTAAGHRRFATEDHLLEMLEMVAKLKHAALNHIEDAGQEAALPHPSCMLTSREGIRVVYTITRESGDYVHHFSLQTAGRPTPPPVGEMLMLFVTTMLGFPTERTALERSPRGIYHGEIALSEAEQREFVEKAPPSRLFPE